jgi:magnesium chelatase subunit D
MSLALAPATAAKGPGLEDIDAASQAAWGLAQTALALVALMPRRLKGAICEGGAPEVRARLEAQLAAWLGPGPPPQRLPAAVTEDRLIGGIDLAATLSAGRMVTEPGLLERADGGLLIVPLAERLAARIAAHLAGTLDEGMIRIEREGLSAARPARFAMLMFADLAGEEDALSPALLDRLAFLLPLGGIRPAQALKPAFSAGAIASARTRLVDITVSDEALEAILVSAAALGIHSMRAPAFCLAAATGLAALGGREAVSEKDIQLAARLVYGPRAAPPLPPQDQPPPEEPPADTQDQVEESGEPAAQELADRLVEAVRLTLEREDQRRRAARMGGRKAAAPGKSGERVESVTRGSPRGARPGDPRRGGRLDLIATLTAAVPWQRLRPAPGSGAALAVRPSDFRVKRLSHRSEAVVIFVVDASGSSAMNRLAEAKGAIEYLLSGCYARRESAALIAFRKQGAELLLPPTRSLTRVKRALARLPGGGGTPLASGMAAGLALADRERRRRRSPHIVFLSDGQGNVALSGEPGREGAAADAEAVARRLKAAGHSVLFLDISRRPALAAQAISAAMGAIYRPLPFADGRQVSETVRSLLLQ